MLYLIETLGFFVTFAPIAVTNPFLFRQFNNVIIQNQSVYSSTKQKIQLSSYQFLHTNSILIDYYYNFIVISMLLYYMKVDNDCAQRP